MAKGVKTGGRKAGTPNRVTADIKDAILAAFKKVGAEEYLATIATTKPDAFCTLLGKVMPTQITGEGEGPVKLVVEWSKSPGS